jgi:hypothetical protein
MKKNNDNQATRKFDDVMRRRLDMSSAEPTNDVYLSSPPRDLADYATQTSARTPSRRTPLVPPRPSNSQGPEWPSSQKGPSCIWAFRDDKVP